MSKNRFRIGADIPPKIRANLLQLFPPEHPISVCRGLTWAYGVDSDYAYPTESVQVAIIGRCVDHESECLLVQVNGRITQVGNRILHITHSLVKGVRPVRAGQIDMSQVLPASTVMFDVTFSQHPLWVDRRVPA